MPLRDFRSVEYCRLKKDFSWDTQHMLIPFELSFDEAATYIWNELNGMNLLNDIQNITILVFPEETITVTG
jgi:hypothetical protein